MQNIAVGILENRNDDVAASMRDVPLQCISVAEEPPGS
jgi:hypothetical protein